MSPRKPRAFDIQDFLSSAGLGRTLVSYPAKTTVFAQGDSADAVFYIQKGRAKLSVTSERGKEATVALLTAGDFLGVECIASDHPVRTTSAIAITACSTLRIAKKAMLEVLRKEHSMSGLLVSHLLVRNSQIQADLVDHLFNSAERRLARALLMLTRFGKDDRVEPVLPKISHEELAEIVGTTRARISFFMNRFRRLGFIEYNGGLEVRSTLLSVVLHD